MEGEGEGEGEGGSAFPVDVIARLISEWYLGLAPEAQAAFVAEALRVGSFMGEVNRSDSEHIIAIPKTFIEFYSVLDKVTGRPLDPQHTLELLQRHSLPHVPMSLHPIRELSPVVAAVRADSTAEGAVLYINNVRGEVIGLLKVKSNYYVIGRRLRETLKSQALNPLRRARGPLGVLPLDAVDTAEAKVESRLARGMAALAWVPGCSEHHAVWAALATGYAKWWLGRVRAAGALTEALLGEVENTFASSLVRYFTQGGRPVTFEPYLTPGDASAPSS